MNYKNIFGLIILASIHTSCTPVWTKYFSDYATANHFSPNDATTFAKGKKLEVELIKLIDSNVDNANEIKALVYYYDTQLKNKQIPSDRRAVLEKLRREILLELPHAEPRTNAADASPQQPRQQNENTPRSHDEEKQNSANRPSNTRPVLPAQPREEEEPVFVIPII